MYKYCICAYSTTYMYACTDKMSLTTRTTTTTTASENISHKNICCFKLIKILCTWSNMDKCVIRNGRLCSALSYANRLLYPKRVRGCICMMIKYHLLLFNSFMCVQDCVWLNIHFQFRLLLHLQLQLQLLLFAVSIRFSIQVQVKQALSLSLSLDRWQLRK